MNINFSGYRCRRSVRTLNRQHSLVNTLLNKKKSGNQVRRDLFSRTGNNIYDIGLYTAPARKIKGNVSNAVLDMINFEYRDCKRQTDDGFFFGGVEYPKSKIPSVSTDRCSEIKAKNNAIVFETGKYYKFTDQRGKSHVLACSYGQLGQPYSDTSRGIVDDASYSVGKFWNMLAKDGTYIGSYYSLDTERKLLNDAGITEGFFSVQVGDHKQEYFYSNGSAGIAVPKWRYDDTYNMFMKHNDIAFRDYEPGSVFKIGGKEYVLSEDKKLDIPYGADIYDIEYPPRKN